IQEILDLQEAKQKVAREVKSKDSSLLAFANKLKEAERVLDTLVDDYRKPKRSKTEDSSSSVTTTVSSQLTLKDILAYAHKISYTTFAPPEFGAGQAPLRGALPPAPQDEQMRASQLSTTPSLISTSLESFKNRLQQLPRSEDRPCIAVPSGWKPGMPVELPKDWPMPPPGWKPGDPVVIPPAPRAKEQQQMRLPPGLHRPPDVIQVRAVQLDILESDNSSDYSSDDASSDDEE
uniref:Mediator of RNA polymerase II transcription subunit 4 n=1 Tax=Brassica oleracea var. oleracea TaxID=109376 RepID=A0A0D3AZH3_BRAOL